MNSEDMISLNFPFREFKEGQREIIEEVLRCFQTSNIFILESPTGTGKSAVAYTVGKVLFDIHKKYPNIESHQGFNGPPILILTGNKNLQMQYNRDLGIPTIWSSQEYSCYCYPDQDIHYGDFLCHKENCSFNTKCPYLLSRNNFLFSDIGVTNYHYFFTSQMLKPKILICDEAHLIENILDDMDSFTIDKRMFHNTNEQIKKIFFHPIKKIDFSLAMKKLFSFINDKTELELDDEIVPFLNTVFMPHIRRQNAYLIEELANFRSSYNVAELLNNGNVQENNEILADDIALKKLKSITKLIKKLEIFDTQIEKLKNLTHDKNKIVVSKTKTETTIIKPLIQDTALRFNKLQRRNNDNDSFFLFMSGTICGKDYFKKSLGIAEGRIVNFLSTDSNIPKENRPFYYVPKYNFNYKNKNIALEKAVLNIDAVINKIVLNGKLIKQGIIHSISYENADYIVKNSKFKHLMFIPNKYELRDIQNVMRQRNMILISPNITEGIDLPYDLSRFQIFVKVPYVSLADRWTKLKTQLDPDWYVRKAILTIIQGAGRSVRFEDDKASTFIFDNQFSRLNRKLFPKWFRETIIDII